MKKTFLWAIIFIASGAHAENEKSIKSIVKNVTVFTQGAQVFRSSTVNLNKGVTDLVFNNISPSINPSSVQAGGKGDFIILDVKHQVKYPEPPKETPGTLPKEIAQEIKQLEDSIANLGFISDDIANQKAALTLEKNMIEKNKLANGEGKSDSLAVLKQAMEFFRIKLSDINSKLLKLKKDEKKNNEKTQLVTARLTDLRKYKVSEDPNKPYAPINQIIVTVSADAVTTGTIDINYMVSQAGWIPSYDLRSTTATQPVEITYKASIYQNTGEDWNDINLKLSTSNPNRSNIKPSLPTWYINYYTQPMISGTYKGAREMMDMNSIATNEEMSKEKDEMKKLSPAQSAANYSQLVETMGNVMFDINLAYSIPTDNAMHVVPIKSENLPASYYHYLVPKIECEAFIVASITGWENLNLLPGKANVFYEGTYVGETVLNPAVINDTLDLAFGRDNGVTVTRTKKPVKENNKLIGSEITKTITYSLRMKNNKSKTINLVVEDQIPVAQNKEIKVEMKENSSADYNPETGLLKWNTKLNPKEYQTLSFTYAVTYDKNKPISLY
jgi:uncharacterized protein (TIGR02231 family)